LRCRSSATDLAGRRSRSRSEHPIMGCGASAPAPPPGKEAPPETPAQPVKVEPPQSVEKENKAPQPSEPAKTAAPPPQEVRPAASNGESSAQRTANTVGSSGGEPSSTAVCKGLPERIRTEELIKLCQSSHFDRTQVERLYEMFKVISASGDDDGLIDKSEFQRALGLKRNLFVDRMFELFDTDGDKNINFSEFIAGLSCFTLRAKQAEKARFSFRMYDFNGDDKIDKQELGRMLAATIEDNKLNVTPEQAKKLIDDTFEEANTATPGFIVFEEYLTMVTKKPQMLEFMTIQSLMQMLV